MKTTNYFNTFIQVAEDCPIAAAEVPPQKANERTVAAIQFEALYHHPYRYTSDDVLFQTFAEKKQLAGQEELAEAREAFFAKGQPCFRSSPLTKRYGWGVHSNADGKVALYALESEEYQKLSQDNGLKQVKAMRSKRA